MNAGRIVILDDEPDVAQTVALVVGSVGLEPVITPTASAFFEEIDRRMPEFIALDMVMPDMDGVEVMRRLAERECSAQIIVISGLGGRVLGAAERSALEHGLNIIGAVPKPFSSLELRKLIIGARPNAPAASAPFPTSEPMVSERQLMLALESDQFRLAYQPKVHCGHGQLAGFEALLRWHHPEHGVIMPDRFIPRAERLGLMDLITREVLQQGLAWFSNHFKACRPCYGVGEGEAADASRPTLSFNLSAKNLHDIDFADTLQDLCRHHAIDCDQVILELTETSAMDDPVTSLDLMTRLRMKGFQLSLDDFGTGYSSMAQLVRLPFSEIKVDKTFVMSANRSRESRTAIHSIVELGHNLDMRATAEGVEELATLEFLREVGCDLAQGYYIARPMYGDDALAWCRAHAGSSDPTDSDAT